VNRVVLPHLRRQKQGLVVWVSSSSPAGVGVVDTPFRNRPLRVHFDPTEDGSSVGFMVLDRLRSVMLHRVGLFDVLTPRVLIGLSLGRQCRLQGGGGVVRQ
jgi:hypothetical protein